MGSGRLIASGTVVTMGLAFASAAAYDVYEDFVLEGDPFVSAMGENVLPLLLSVVLVAVGVRILDPAVDRQVSRRVAAGTIAGTMLVLLTGTWIYFFQVSQGNVKPLIIMAQIGTLGGLGGALAGYYLGAWETQVDELEAERDRVAALFENNGVAIVEARFEDGEPMVRRVNDAFEETFGYDEEWLQGRNVDEVIVPDEESDVAGRISSRTETGKSVDDQVTRVTADGTEREFIVRSVPFSDARGNPCGFALYTDITERERYRQRVAALHESSHDLVEAITLERVGETGVRVVSNTLDPAVTVVYHVDETEETLRPVAAAGQAGLTAADLAELPVEGSLPGECYRSGSARHLVVDDAVAFDPALASFPALSVVPLSGHGVLLTGEPAADAVDDFDREIVEILGTAIATHLDRADREQRLRRSEAALERQNQRLEEFASVVSHDIRNPLNVATGRLDLARETGDPEHLDDVADALARMEELIEDLLTMARQGEAVLDPEPLSLEAAAREAWANVETSEATLQVVDDVIIEGARSRVEELFENLYRNAVEHAGPAVTVEVGTAADGFYVADDGPGIPADRREMIFDQGFTTADDGTGFGLAIVERIAEAHGWSVTVQESEAGGAKFVVEC